MNHMRYKNPLTQFKNASEKEKRTLLKKYSNLAQRDSAYFQEFHELFLEAIKDTTIIEWALIQSAKILLVQPAQLTNLIFHYHFLLKQRNWTICNKILGVIMKFLSLFQNHPEFEQILITCNEILIQIQSIRKPLQRPFIDVDVETSILESRILKIFEHLNIFGKISKGENDSSLFQDSLSQLENLLNQENPLFKREAIISIGKIGLQEPSLISPSIIKSLLEILFLKEGTFINEVFKTLLNISKSDSTILLPYSKQIQSFAKSNSQGLIVEDRKKLELIIQRILKEPGDRFGFLEI